jgi:RNA polymerase sigma-70 factor, ECF subfamily
MVSTVGQLSQTSYPTNLHAIDQYEFGALTEPHRRELLAHCYRMSGSIHEAEDLVQETFLRAWRRRETYAGRAPLRTWLYKIATNLCLDALGRHPRRTLPIARQPAATLDEPIPASVAEPIWLEPFPDELLASETVNPEARYLAHESVTLAFMTALHLLPPRQRAVLILRDVLDWQASEVADALGLTVPAVKSVLHRARTTLNNHSGTIQIENPAIHPGDQARQRQLDRYVRAWETADVNALLVLLKAEATFSMPPIPSWYCGREAIGALVSKTIFSGESRGRWRLYPTHANGQPAFGVYRRDQADHGYCAYGIQVVTFDGEQIADIITFRNPSLIGYFNLPTTLPN